MKLSTALLKKRILQKWLLILIIITCVGTVNLWADSSLTYSGYAEGYFAKHSTITRSTKNPFSYIYSFPDNERIDLNHALFQITYQSKTFYGNLGLQAGRYVDTNYAAEPSSVRPLYSASIGTHLSKQYRIEGGIFASHIGLESAIGKDNWTLTRSLLADNSPYYESGLKLSYIPNQQWTFTLLGVNGWQVISDQDNKKAVGTQIQYQFSPSVLLNSSSYISDTRYFHDCYAVIEVSDTFSWAPIIDIGVQDDSVWGGISILARYILTPTTRIAARIEYFTDPHDVVSAGKLSLMGASLNLDYDLATAAMWRNEVKALGDNLSFTTAISYSFSGSLIKEENQ